VHIGAVVMGWIFNREVGGSIPVFDFFSFFTYRTLGPPTRLGTFLHAWLAVKQCLVSRESVVLRYVGLWEWASRDVKSGSVGTIYVLHPKGHGFDSRRRHFFHAFCGSWKSSFPLRVLSCSCMRYASAVLCFEIAVNVMGGVSAS